MKLEADTVSILPVVPPGAGAVRAFDFPFPEPFTASNACPAEVEAAAEVDAGLVEFNVATPTDDPIVPTITADEAIHRFRLL